MRTMTPTECVMLRYAAMNLGGMIKNLIYSCCLNVPTFRAINKLVIFIDFIDESTQDKNRPMPTEIDVDELARLFKDIDLDFKWHDTVPGNRNEFYTRLLEIKQHLRAWVMTPVLCEFLMITNPPTFPKHEKVKPFTQIPLMENKEL